MRAALRDRRAAGSGGLTAGEACPVLTRPTPAVMSESAEGPAGGSNPPSCPTQGAAASTEPRIIKVTVKTPKEKEEFAVSETSSIRQVRAGGAGLSGLVGQRRKQAVGD